MLVNIDVLFLDITVVSAYKSLDTPVCAVVWIFLHLTEEPSETIYKRSKTADNITGRPEH